MLNHTGYTRVYFNRLQGDDVVVALIGDSPESLKYVYFSLSVALSFIFAFAVCVRRRTYQKLRTTYFACVLLNCRLFSPVPASELDGKEEDLFDVAGSPWFS